MNPGAGVPWRPLALITLGVLALHVAALRESPRTWRPAGERLAVRLSMDAPSDASASATAPVVAHSHAHAHATATATAAATAMSRRAGTEATRPARTTRAAPSAPSPTDRGSTTLLDAQPATPTRPPVPRTLPTTLPGSATWHYDLTSSSRGVAGRGSATLAWRQDEDRYEIVLTMALPDGRTRIQRSAGRVDAHGLAPDRFSDRARTEEAAHFDRASSRVVFSSQRPAAALRPGAQDRASVLLQLASLVAADPARWRADTRWTAQVAGTREADEWTFVAQGEELLDGPAGPLPTIRLLRAARGPYDWALTLWLAPGGDYGPVRLRLTAPGGDWLDMQWSGTDKG